MHGLLTRRDERPQWAVDADIPIHESAGDYSEEELRSGYLAYYFGEQGPGISRPLTPQQRAAVERYLREQAAKRRRRPTEGYKVDEATPGDTP